MEFTPAPTRLRFLLRWIGSTILFCVTIPFIALAAGSVSEIISRLSPDIPQQTNDLYGLILLALTPLMSGGAMGFIQWLIVLQEAISARVWVLTSAITSILVMMGLVLAAQIAPPFLDVQVGRFSGMDNRFVLSDSWLNAALIFGFCTGIASGVPQWMVARRYFYGAESLLIAIIAGALGFFLSITVLVYTVKNTVLVGALSCCISPVTYAGITGLALYGLLQRPKRPNT